MKTLFRIVNETNYMDFEKELNQLSNLGYELENIYFGLFYRFKKTNTFPTYQFTELPTTSLLKKQDNNDFLELSQSLGSTPIAMITNSLLLTTGKNENLNDPENRKAILNKKISSEISFLFILLILVLFRLPFLSKFEIQVLFLYLHQYMINIILFLFIGQYLLFKFINRNKEFEDFHFFNVKKSTAFNSILFILGVLLFISIVMTNRSSAVYYSIFILVIFIIGLYNSFKTDYSHYKIKPKKYEFLIIILLLLFVFYNSKNFEITNGPSNFSNLFVEESYNYVFPDSELFDFVELNKSRYSMVRKSLIDKYKSSYKLVEKDEFQGYTIYKNSNNTSTLFIKGNEINLYIKNYYYSGDFSPQEILDESDSLKH